MKFGEELIVLKQDDEYRGRTGTVVGIIPKEVKLRFKDGTERMYSNVAGDEIMEK